MLEAGIDVSAVWLTPDATTVRACRALLSPDEIATANRFAFDHLRVEYQIAHGALRLLLAGHLQCDPREIRFRRGRRGKPELDGPGEIRFNLAHSGSLALYGFASGCDIGIDVEECRPLPNLELVARDCFGESETLQILHLDTAEDRLQAFYRCWTRKEAYVKAVGEGLFHPLQRFEVTVSDAAPAAFVHIGDDEAEARLWRLHHLTPALGYTGALAYYGEARNVRTRPPMDAVALLACRYAGGLLR